MLARGSLSVLKSGIEEGLFSGAAYALVSKRASGGVGTLGRVDFDPDSFRVNRDTLFDVASLTKPLVTSMAILQLVERGVLRLPTEVVSLFPQSPNLAGITVQHLLIHTSGLPAVPMAPDGTDGDQLALALASVPATSPGTAYLYSDTGYILLGEIVRKVSGRSLAEWFTQKIMQPLHLAESGFCPDPSLPIVATTDDESFDGKPNDPRARAIGGIAGHAGLFGSINDIAAYARALLGSGRALLEPSLFQRLFATELDPSIGFQSLGFFCPGHLYMPEVPGFGEGSVAHSGFTGCYILIDRPQQAAACLLTNRVLNTHEDASRFLAMRREWLAAAARDLGLVDGLL